MRRVASLLAAVGLLATTGCTDQPLAAPRVFGPVTFQTWAQQDQANSVQDWHRMALRIADSMQARGLLPVAEVESGGAPPPAFFVRPAQETPFVQELSRALKTELLRRQALLAASPNGALVVDIGANVVVWGSRAVSDPDRLRTEGVWYASLSTGNRILMTVQEPFFIAPSDISQYVQVPTRLARTLRYSE